MQNPWLTFAPPACLPADTSVSCWARAIPKGASRPADLAPARSSRCAAPSMLSDSPLPFPGSGEATNFTAPVSQEPCEPGGDPFGAEAVDPSEWVNEQDIDDDALGEYGDGGLEDYGVPAETELAHLSLSPDSGGNDASSAAPMPVFGSGSFPALGLSEELCRVLAANDITNPTRVQQRCIPPILGGADVVLGAATGSGKTYAYLLPVVMSLKAAEALRSEGDPPLRIARRPRAIVIVPTRELAEQVLAVTKTLSYAVKFRVVGATTGAGSSGLKKLKDLLAASPVDVLVTTTGRLLQLLEVKAIDLRFTRHIVVDEVDTMFDAGFGPELQRILRSARGRGDVVNKPQYIAAGATHPKAAEAMYEVEFPAAKRLDVDLHLPPPGLDARFIRTTADGKVQELVSLLGDCRKDGHMKGGRLIIFCNTISSARFLEHFLSESGYTTASVHGEIPPERRASEFQSFKSGKVQLLVCTDIAARGLDNLDIAHVIIFDFPTSAVDYIHRAGRTARAGAEGRVTSLVLKKDLALARAIERSGKERQDALVIARIAREKEEARKAQNEQNRRENQSSPGGLGEDEVLFASAAPPGRSGKRGSWGGDANRRGRGGGRGRGVAGRGRGRGNFRGASVERSRDGIRRGGAYSAMGGGGESENFSGGQESRRGGRRSGSANDRGRGRGRRRGSGGGRSGGL